jgi:hypothetical protein
VQYLRDVANPRTRSNSGGVERVADSSARVPAAGQVLVQLSAAALALGVALFVSDRLVSAARADLLAVDFRQTYLPAGEALLHGHSPYPAYGYPPLVAFLSLPFALAPSPDVLATVLMLACVPVSLWLFGVRDPRCYAAAFLWGSVFNAVQTANVTLPILVGAAACWRWRDDLPTTAFAGGLAVAAKIIAWPLAVWLAATRRWRSAAGVVAVSAGVSFVLWAILGFSGLAGYVDSLGQLADKEAQNGYTIKALGGDLGLPDPVSSGLGSALALLALAAVVAFGRRGDDARSFASAMVAMIVASPIIWLHSFALLLGSVAVLRPRFSAVWLIPFALWFFSTGTGNGAPWQTALTLAVAAVVVAAALWPTGPVRSEPSASSGRTAPGEA